jgi:prephenate dehydratase
LERNLPGRPVTAANSNAESVQTAVATPGIAGIGPVLAAEIYGGEILERHVEDYAGNQTRFVEIGRGLRAKTGTDKTSLALFMKEDRSGTLHMILGEFVYGDINLTKIQSRPTKRQLGRYMFFIDLEGHVDDANVRTALDCLRLKLREVKVLGSYPRV